MKGLFFGSKSLGLAMLQNLFLCDPQIEWQVVHPDDVGDARSIVDDFDDFAKRNNIALSVVKNQIEGRAVLNNVQPDIVFVCGWYWLFNEMDLKVPSLGIWGIHNSLLPKYRGGSPLVWALINGDEIVGTSVFKLSSGIDSGPILHQIEIDVQPDWTIGNVLRQIEDRLIKELPAKWTALLNGDADLVEQDHGNASYCGQRFEHDGRINWALSSREIHNFINAQADPYPGAFCFLGKKKLQLLETKICEGKFYGTPGQVLHRSIGSVIISCGATTALELVSLKYNGSIYASPEVVVSMRFRLE